MLRRMRMQSGYDHYAVEYPHQPNEKLIRKLWHGFIAGRKLGRDMTHPRPEPVDIY